MDALETTRTASVGPKPKRLAIGDIFLLIMGIALVFVLQSQHGAQWMPLRIFLPNPPPGSPPSVQLAGEVAFALRLLAFMIMPVILVRTARPGALPSTADWLTLAIAFATLNQGLSFLRQPLSDAVDQLDGVLADVIGLPIDLTPEGVAILLGLMLVILLLLFGRHLMPGAKPIVIVVLFVLLVWGPITGATEAIAHSRMYPHLGQPGYPTPARKLQLDTLREALAQIPWFLYFAIPATAAAFDLIRSRGRFWRLAGWLGFLAALGLFGTWVASEFVIPLSSPPMWSAVALSTPFGTAGTMASIHLIDTLTALLPTMLLALPLALRLNRTLEALREPSRPA
jgi:hypothetical protein